MFRLGAPSDSERAALLRVARDATPTFDRPGATRSDGEIPGFRFDRYEDVVGRDWDRARDGLRAWAAHRGANLVVTPSDAALAPGETVVITGRALGPLHVIIPCRVSYVVDDPTRFGFAYVTLPGHPECGEEAFMLSRADDKPIVFTMSSYSRPAELLARLGGPLTREIQRRTNHAYIAGLRAFVAG